MYLSSGKLNQVDLSHSSPFAHAEAALAWLFFGVTELRKFKVSGRVYSESLALIRKGWWEGVQRRRLGRQRFALGSKGRWRMTNIREPKTAGIPSNSQETGAGGRIYSSSVFATLLSPICLARGEKKRGNTKQVEFTCFKKPNSLSKRSIQNLLIEGSAVVIIVSSSRRSQSTTRPILARQICIFIR